MVAKVGLVFFFSSPGRTSSCSSIDNISATPESQNHHPLSSDDLSKNPESNSMTSDRDREATLSLSCIGDFGNPASSPSHPADQKPRALKASDWSLNHTEEFSQWSSKPKSAQSTAHLSESTCEGRSLLNSLHRVAPLPKSANQNLSVSRVADWPPAVSWDSEMWASEQSLVGNQGNPANGRCLKWRGENATRHGVTYLGDSARPVKVTLVKTSF